MITTKVESAAVCETGWLDGAPHIPPEVVAIDMACYKRYPCGACGARRPLLLPQHRGREYRLVARCRACGHEEGL